MRAGSLQSRPTLCNPIECNPPGFPVHRILQAKILEWVAISFSRGSSRPKDQSQVSCIGGRFFFCACKQILHHLAHQGSFSVLNVFSFIVRLICLIIIGMIVMIQMFSQVLLHSYSAHFEGQEAEAWRVWMALDQHTTIRRSWVSKPEVAPGAQQRWSWCPLPAR